MTMDNLDKRDATIPNDRDSSAVVPRAVADVEPIDWEDRDIDRTADIASLQSLLQMIRQRVIWML